MERRGGEGMEKVCEGVKVRDGFFPTFAIFAVYAETEK